MTYRKYFDSDDPDGPQQFYDSIAGQAASRTMGRDEKGAFVEYEPAKTVKTLSAESPEIQEFLKAWHDNGRPEFEARYKALVYDVHERKTAKTRRKYIALDRDGSGMYLVDRSSGEVYSIKAYGVPNRYLGNLSAITAAFREATAKSQSFGYPGYVGSDAKLREAATKTGVGLKTALEDGPFLPSDSGFIDISRLPVLPLAIALVAGYAIHFMVMQGIFNALSIIGR